MAGTVQALAAFADVLEAVGGYESFVRVVLAYRVGNRPDRFEPHAQAPTQALPAPDRPQRPSTKAARPFGLKLQEVPFASTR